MRRVDFARLAGITPGMVTKYANDGLIVLASAQQVDPRASLAALEGHLDETKRRAALSQLDVIERRDADLGGIAAAVPAPAPFASATPSPKAQADGLKAQLLALELAERAGALIPTDQVERQAWNAVATMRQALEMARRDMAVQLCRDLGLPQERVGVVSRHIQRMHVAALTTFSREMRAMTGAANDPQSDQRELELSAPADAA